MNAFNMIDGINGLAQGCAMVALLLLLVFIGINISTPCCIADWFDDWFLNF